MVLMGRDACERAREPSRSGLTFSSVSCQRPKLTRLGGGHFAGKDQRFDRFLPGGGAAHRGECLKPPDLRARVSVSGLRRPRLLGGSLFIGQHAVQHHGELAGERHLACDQSPFCWAAAVSSSADRDALLRGYAMPRSLWVRRISNFTLRSSPRSTIGWR